MRMKGKGGGGEGGAAFFACKVALRLEEGGGGPCLKRLLCVRVDDVGENDACKDF
jgi:hypothetical protein